MQHLLRVSGEDNQRTSDFQSIIHATINVSNSETMSNRQWCAYNHAGKRPSLPTSFGEVGCQWMRTPEIWEHHCLERKQNSKVDCIAIDARTVSIYSWMPTLLSNTWQRWAWILPAYNKIDKINWIGKEQPARLEVSPNLPSVLHVPIDSNFGPRNQRRMCC